MERNDERDLDLTGGQREPAQDAVRGAHRGEPSVAEEVGEAAGGISGVLVGAGIGSAAGPVGTLIGGIAGAIGGWWAGRAIAEAAEKLTPEDDAYYQAHYEASPGRLSDRGYGDVRGAYYLGHIAGHNPDYAELQFDDVEPELQRGWASYADKYGQWSTVRDYSREGFGRGRAAGGAPHRTADGLRTDGALRDGDR